MGHTPANDRPQPGRGLGLTTVVPVLAIAALAAITLSACSGSSTSTPSATAASASSPGTSASTPADSKPPAASPTANKTPSSPKATPDATKEAPAAPSLEGDTHNAIAYAPLDDPGNITVKGELQRDAAWSTSKVLVILSYIKTVAGGDPDRLSAYDKEQIRKALTSSDMNALLYLRGKIPGGSGPQMTQILRSIGDDETSPWPDSNEGSHDWSIRNQVKFMAALQAGKVVNPQTSKFVISQMHPVESQSWGLGTIGASAIKGGWLTQESETRQMGIVDGYSVAIITDAGPAVPQSDGDDAHVQAINKLAQTLKQTLAAEKDG